MSERRSGTLCAVVKRPDHHCGDDRVCMAVSRRSVFICLRSGSANLCMTNFTVGLVTDACASLQPLTCSYEVCGYWRETDPCSQSNFVQCFPNLAPSHAVLILANPDDTLQICEFEVFELGDD